MLSARKSHQVDHYNIILLGKTGVGKSASGNTFLGEKVFVSKKSAKPVTNKVGKERVTFDGVILDVYDTPGLFDPRTKNENDISEWKKLLSQTICPVILLVMKADTVSQEDKQVVDLIEDVIPEWRMQNVWILFTRGDELERENLSIEEFIEDTDELKEIVQRFQNRYHVFNNKSESSKQVRMLIQKIRDSVQITSPNMEHPQTTPPDDLHRRIVLLGKTGVGKSATGNTILGDSRFRSEISASSVTSKCEIQEAVVSGRKISVIDTPGLFDTKLTPKQLAKELGRISFLSRPGPHAFLYVLSVNGRFTTQEENVMQKLEVIFGEKLRKHTIIVFTYGDLLERKSVDMFIQENNSLRLLIKQCEGRFHVMNNKQRKKQQVTDLLEKIDRIIQKNQGTHYTSEMFNKAMKFKVFKEFFLACKNSLVTAASVGCGGGALSGVVIAASIGAAVGGPVGAGIGAVAGTLLGGATGIGVGVGVHKVVNKQEGQSAAHTGDEEDSVPNTDDGVIGTETENVLLLPRSSNALKQRSRSGRS